MVGLALEQELLTTRGWLPLYKLSSGVEVAVLGRDGKMKFSKLPIYRLLPNAPLYASESGSSFLQYSTDDSGGSVRAVASFTHELNDKLSRKIRSRLRMVSTGYSTVKPVYSYTAGEAREALSIIASAHYSLPDLRYIIDCETVGDVGFIQALAAIAGYRTSVRQYNTVTVELQESPFVDTVKCYRIQNADAVEIGAIKPFTRIKGVVTVV